MYTVISLTEEVNYKGYPHHSEAVFNVRMKVAGTDVITRDGV